MKHSLCNNLHYSKDSLEVYRIALHFKTGIFGNNLLARFFFLTTLRVNYLHRNFMIKYRMEYIYTCKNDKNSTFLDFRYIEIENSGVLCFTVTSP